MRSFQLIDYTKDFSYSFVKKYADSIGNKISIISTQIILDKKYFFTFDIDRKYFSRLREKNGFFNLYKIIDAAISLIYAKLRITTFFRIDADDLPKKDADQVIDATIVHPFLAELTSTELDYLKMIVSGCTAKEMAIHMNKSYRTVQTMIANMLKKLKLENKEELILVAKIVM
jgi:DNA-binding CsgD family transcriptional regulator